MNLLEHEAKHILKAHKLPTPNGLIITNAQHPISTPVVLKSQVPIGGRGKLGGIKIAHSQHEVAPLITQLLSHEIKGYTPKTILVEELLTIEKELYLSILIDRNSASVQLVAHPKGGVEVEENEASEFLKITITPSGLPTIGEQLAELYNTPEQSFALQEIAENLHDCFMQNDATLIEINPLILTKNDSLVAGDCKMTLDDAAAFRHPKWDFEQTSKEVNFVPLNPHGTVATIANGAGLAMATVDAVADAGMTPANFLDIGGGANAESVLTAFRRIMEYPNVKAIVINIFAGITRCDEVAKAIITAHKQLPNLSPLCIRLAGTNYDEAKALLDHEGIDLLPTLKQCLDTAHKEVYRG